MTADILQTTPLFILAGGALLLLLVEAVWPHSDDSFGILETITFVSLIGALCALVFFADEFTLGKVLFAGTLIGDGFSYFFTLMVIGGALGAVLMGLARLSLEGIDTKGEWYALVLFSTVGAILFGTAGDLITMFLGLEIMSVAVYALCGSSLHFRGAPMKRSSEAALKYFLLGSFSSAFFLYGAALIYGVTGTLSITGIGAHLASSNPTILFLGLGLLLVGVCFKVGAVPFHFWLPDTYQGAPTTVTAFMASVVKMAAVAGILRVLWGAFHSQVIFWSGAVWVIAVLTMVCGNILALRQRSLKRMLAYSSIAHAGYILCAVLSVGGGYNGGAAILYYLVVYSLVTIGAFGVVLAVTAEHTESQHPDDISRFNALGRRRPLLAAFMALFMLSFAGLPPGVSGLIGKMYLFSAALHADYPGLAIIGVLASAISCYYYLRVIVAMYFVEFEGDHEEVMPLGASLGSTLMFCAIATVLLGIFPDKLYLAAQNAVLGF